MKTLSVEATHVMDVLHGKISLADKKEAAANPPETWEEKLERLRRRKDVDQRVASLSFTRYLESSARADSSREEYMELLVERSEELTKKIKNSLKHLNLNY